MLVTDKIDNKIATKASNVVTKSNEQVNDETKLNPEKKGKEIIIKGQL